MKLKDPLSGLLHFIGAVTAVPATAILIIAGLDSVWKIVAFSVYGATLILVFSVSTIYHWLPVKAGGRFQVFRKMDHLMIYAFIAGSYTPFCLVTLNGPWGWTLFGCIWGSALLGMTLQTFFIDAPRWLTTGVYIMMGWLVVIAIKPLLSFMSTLGLWLLAGGGVVYSLGGVVYTLKKPNFGRYFNYHDLWHVFVLGGATLHYLALLWIVA